MTTDAPVAFERGVRFRQEPDGTAMLLVPEGALQLNPTAAAALELVDGKRTVDAIVHVLCERFDVVADDARRDVLALFDRLERRRMVRA